jgi:hypothetical protein
MIFGPPTPILRIFDEAKMRELYVGFLGFQVDWEHRFEPGTPIYLQVSLGGCKLHLSENHGDGSPGARVRIEVDELEGYHLLQAVARAAVDAGLSHRIDQRS